MLDIMRQYLWNIEKQLLNYNSIYDRQYYELGILRVAHNIVMTPKIYAADAIFDQLEIILIWLIPTPIETQPQVLRICGEI